MRAAAVCFAVTLFAPTTRADDDPHKVVTQSKPFGTPGQEWGRLHATGQELAKPFLWPLKAPNGAAVTRAWPMDKKGAKTTDHVHQKSAWFTYGDIVPEGVPVGKKPKNVAGVDFWAEGANHGKIVCADVQSPNPPRAAAFRFVLKNEWLTAEGTKLFDETRTITGYDRGTARLLVFDLDIDASICPLTFADTKEGAFGVRVADSIAVKPGKGDITLSSGRKGEKDCWGEVAEWCDYSGLVDGQEAGISIFDHAKNPAPACWHVRDYGLMAANPFGRKASGFPAMRGRSDIMKLGKGAHWKFRYGLLLHNGNSRTGLVAEHYQAFKQLPLPE